MPMQNAGWHFDNSYARLPGAFFVRQEPVAVREPKLLVLNRKLAQELGLNPEALQGEEGAALFAGNLQPPGSEPLAQAYAGHQFGYPNMLGDGRALLLGEQLTPSGARLDLQLKGSGQTPCSRRGDGRAALGPMLREYIISEAMHALGIPTTRSLAVATTGEPVFREQPLPGAVLTRVASSHIRVGTFEYAAARGDEALRILADYTLQRHYPALAGGEEPYRALLLAVIDRQAALIAEWMRVGFIHGVMNTDNMTLSGETIDYGPCAFLDSYSPATVFSSIDRDGRYAFGNQPRIGAWNLARLAETLLPLLHANREEAVKIATSAIETYRERYRHHWLRSMGGKLGLADAAEDDASLIEELLAWMEREQADYTNCFRALSSEQALAKEPGFSSAEFQNWKARWEARLSREKGGREAAFARMQAFNPEVIPRNHRVEEALAAAAEREDLAPMKKLLAALEKPYEDSPAHEGYREPAPASAGEYRTFCGT